MSSSVGRKHGGRNELFSTSRREELALGPANRRGQKPSAAKARITVTVRKKPLSSEEINKNESDVIDVVDRQNLILQEPRKELAGNEKTTSHLFTFDRVYDESCSNHYIYNSCVKKLVDTVFKEGSRCSCFAFGQTGSGKTYTMMGTRKSEAKGLWEWAAGDIIAWMSKPKFKDCELAVSFFEIHCNKAYDLLNNRNPVRPLENSDGGVVVKDLTETEIHTQAEMLELIDIGNNARSTGRNSRNNESSRSHAILSIVVRQSIGGRSGHSGINSRGNYKTANHNAGGSSTGANRGKDKVGPSNDRASPPTSSDSNAYTIYGKIAFIDLAGSERGADTVQFGRPAQQDGAGINKSLLALKECIRAMDQGKGHIPFRDSELTKILRDFFTNPNGLCLMIATTSSSFSCVEQTLNTLRYAQRFIAVRQNAKPCIDEPPENMGTDNHGAGGDLFRSIGDIGPPEPDQLSAEPIGPNSSDHNSSSEGGEIDSADRIQPRALFADREYGSRLHTANLVDPTLSSSSSRSANCQPARANIPRIVRRDQAGEPCIPPTESKTTNDSPTGENYIKHTEFLRELSEELQMDLQELLDDTFDAKTRELVHRTVLGNTAASSLQQKNNAGGDGVVRNLSDEDFRNLFEESSSEVWTSYRELLGHQTVYLRDVCQLIQAHVRICKMMDNDLEKRNGMRPSLATNPATLSAKTACIDPNALETSRVFLEREIGALLKLAQELNRVQASLQKCSQLEKEERRRAVQTVQVYNKRGKPAGN